MNSLDVAPSKQYGPKIVPAEAMLVLTGLLQPPSSVSNVSVEITTFPEVPVQGSSIVGETDSDGFIVGTELGKLEGVLEGTMEGTNDGRPLGRLDGDTEGSFDGDVEGT